MINKKLTDKRVADILARAEICDDSVLTDYADIAAAMRELQESRKAISVPFGDYSAETPEILEQQGGASISADPLVDSNKPLYTTQQPDSDCYRMARQGVSPILVLQSRRHSAGCTVRIANWIFSLSAKPFVMPFMQHTERLCLGSEKTEIC